MASGGKEGTEKLQPLTPSIDDVMHTRSRTGRGRAQICNASVDEYNYYLANTCNTVISVFDALL